jgi:HNH endonuclease
MQRLKPIQSYPGYYATSNGQIFGPLKRLTLGLRRLPQFSNGNYLCCYVNSNLVRVHRLVLEAFYSPPKQGYVGHHKDHVKINNRILNLEWLTQVET